LTATGVAKNPKGVPQCRTQDGEERRRERRKKGVGGVVTRVEDAGRPNNSPQPNDIGEEFWEKEKDEPCRLITKKKNSRRVEYGSLGLAATPTGESKLKKRRFNKSSCNRFWRVVYAGVEVSLNNKTTD